MGTRAGGRDGGGRERPEGFKRGQRSTSPRGQQSELSEVTCLNHSTRIMDSEVRSRQHQNLLHPIPHQGPRAHPFPPPPPHLDQTWT